MAYPMYPFHSNTERGVASLRWSLLLAFTMQTLAVVTLIPVGYYIANPPTTYLSDFVTILPLLLTVILLGIVAMVFFLSGLARLHAGRDEYGPEHARNAEAVVIFTVIAFVVGVSALTFGGTFGIVFPTDDPVGLAVTGALTVVRGLFVGLAFAFSVRALVRPEETSAGTFAVIALAVGPGVGAGVSMALLNGLPLPSTTLYIALAGLGVGAAIELVGYILFYRQYTALTNRIRSGELASRFRPQPMPFVPYPPPYVPGYGMPYYPAYPAQPPQYPPQGPPQQPPPQP